MAFERPHFAEYCYTDVSHGFLDRGRAMFPQHADTGRMKFALLDIEADPIQQSIAYESYDLVIAVNVIHATKSIEVSLNNARRVLRSGGHFILIETTCTDLVSLQLIFGLFPGWWLASEDERKNSPLLTEDEWDHHFKSSGFSGVDARFRSHADPQYHVYSAMISTRLENDGTLPIQKVGIVVDGDNSQQVELARGISEQLGHGTSSMIINTNELHNERHALSHYILLPELHHPIIHGASEDTFKLIQEIFRTANSVIWAHGDAETQPLSHLITGIQRTYRLENESLALVTLCIQGKILNEMTASNILRLLHRKRVGSILTFDDEYVEVEGSLHIKRIIENKSVNVYTSSSKRLPQPEARSFGEVPQRALKLSIGTVGLLNTLHFSQDSKASDPLGEDEIEIELRYSGLNFKDLLSSLGQTNDALLGLEGSGVVSRVGIRSGFKVGDHVCALLLGSFQTFARCQKHLARKIPQHLDLQSTAGLPIVFCTAYHSLVNLGQIKKNDTVLVHSGAGGLGQAIIQLAKLYDARIFATAGTAGKRKFLVEEYGLQANQVFSSRSTAFAQGIKAIMKGQGVDIVVNSLSGEALQASWECLAPFGHFIETGRKDIEAFGKLSMTPFASDATFTSISLTNIVRRKPLLAGKLLEQVLDLAERSQISTPHPVQVFGVDRLEEAYRLMQSGKSSGKILIELQKDAIVPTMPSPQAPCILRSDMSYIITGGLGGLGQSVARWMVSRGAKHLILVTRSAKTSEEITCFLEDMKNAGAIVKIAISDICDQENLASALEDCKRSMPPIKGCIQSAMVLKDGLFTSMSKSDFDAVVKPKVDGSWHLHNLLPRGLDFFILFSSISGIAPSYGQTNYAAGNTFQDALARYRIGQEERAASIDIGMVIDAGYVANNARLAEQLTARGATPVYIKDVLKLLDFYCDASRPICTASEAQTIIGLRDSRSLRAQGSDEPLWMQRPIFSFLAQSGSADNATDAVKQESGTLVHPALKTLLPTASAEMAAEQVTEALAMKLAKVLIMDRDDIAVTVPMNAYGVDSLVAMELRQWFRKEVQADIATFEVLGNAPLKAVAAVAASRSDLRRVIGNAKHAE